MMRTAVLSALCMVLFSTTGLAFGWFSSGAETGSMHVQSGRVAIKQDNEAPEGDVRAIRWTGLHTAHLELEQQTDAAFHQSGAQPEAVQHALDSSFRGWWRANEDSLNDFFEESLWVSPGGFLVKQYRFVSESTVPAYFRIEKPRISVAGHSDRCLNVAVLARASWQGQPEALRDDSATDVLLADPGPADPYLYLTHPVEPGQQFQITFVIYVLSQANDDVFQKQQAVFSAGSAELIQAQNNAVCLDDEWRHAAESGVSFLPYAQS